MSDPGGMANTEVVEAVRYPGSSEAFALLLSGLKRDGLTAREVRGKRTCRIILVSGVEPGRPSAATNEGRAGGRAELTEDQIAVLDRRNRPAAARRGELATVR